MQLRALQTMAEGGMPPRMIQIGDVFEANDIVARDYLTRGQAVEVKTPRTAGTREYIAAAPASAIAAAKATPTAAYTGKKRGPKPKNKQRNEPSNKSVSAG